MAYIISSGITSDGIILEYDSMTILNGGTANNTTATEDGCVAIYSGGTANDTTLDMYSYMYVYEGGTANGITLDNESYLYVYEGGTANGVALDSNSWIEVHEGGTLTSATLNANTWMEIYESGSANYITINSETYLGVQYGAVVNHITVNDTNLEVFGTINDLTINRGGSVTFYEEGILNSAVVNPGASLSIYDYDTSATAIVENGGYVEFADETRVSFQSNVIPALDLDGISATIHSGTTANSVTVHSGAVLRIYSGGVANNIAENGGYVELNDGAQATFRPNTFSGLTLSSSASATVHSGTTLNSATVHSGAALRIYSGGVANDLVENGGYVELNDGAQATFQSNSIYGITLVRTSATVHSGTTASNTLVSSGGLLYVAGGTADRVTVSNGGQLMIHSGGTATGIVVSSGGRLEFTVTPDTVVTGTSNGRSINVSDGLLTNYILGSGAMTIAAGVVAENTTITYGGDFRVSGGTATNTVVSSGGTLSLDGAVADIVTVSAYGRLTVADGTATNISAAEESYYSFTVTADSIIQGTIGETGFEFRDGIVSDFAVKGNTLTVDGAEATGLSVADWGAITVVNGRATGTVVDSSGSMTVTGGTAAGTAVNEGGMFTIGATGTATDTTVNANGSAFVSSGGAADGILVGAGGSLVVSAGATVTNLTAEDGAVLNLSVSPDTFITGTYAGTTFEIKGGAISGYSIQTGSLSILSGGTAETITVSNGSLYVEEGGSADAIRVTGGSLVVSSGGTATNIDWTPCEGRIYIEDGGSVSFVSQYSGVYYGSNNHLISHADVLNGLAGSGYQAIVYIMSGGTANGTVFNRASMFISSGGTANDTFLNSGWMTLYDGGSANRTQIIDGKLTISRGGTAEDTTVYYGSLNVSSGGTANKTNVQNSGRMNVIEGVANSATVNSGAVLTIDGGTATNIVENGGFVSCTTADVEAGRVTFASNTISGLYLNGYTATLHSGTTMTDIVVDRNGELRISSGGKLTGKIVCARNSFIRVSSGGIIDFDVTKVKPGETTAIITDAYRLQEYGTPNYTITVTADQAEGTYRLADDFNYNNTFKRSPFTIMNQEGVQLGTLSVGEAITIGDYVYSLTTDYYSSSSSSYRSLFLTVGSSGSYSTQDGLVLIRSTVYVRPGEVFRSTTVLSSGRLYVSSGGLVEDTFVNNYYGSVFISSGGTATGTVLNGYMSVYRGGVADSTTLNPGCMLRIEGGTATNIVENGGFVSCSIADITEGRVTFASNTISGFNINGYSATIHSGTTVNSAILDYRGRLMVSSGGKVTGRIMLVSNGELTISSGGILDFDISGIKPGGSNAIINDFYYVRVSGTPVYTITVSDDQAAGLYRLADDIRNTFKGSFTVVNTSGTTLGTLTVGQSSIISGVSYTLGMEYLMNSYSGKYGSSLVLRIGSDSNPYVMEGLIVTSSDKYPIASGMAVRGTYVMDNGRLFISSGGTAIDTTVFGSGIVSVYRGVAKNTMLSGGFMDVREGSIVSGATVNVGGSMRIARNVTAVDVVENGGFVSCYDPEGVTFASHTISSLNLNSRGSASIHSGTTANDTMVAGGFLYVYSGGIANGTMISDRGRMIVASGALTDRTTVHAGGSLTINGGTATGIVADDGASLRFTVESDTRIAGTSGGSAFEIQDGRVSGFTIGSGELSIRAGALAEDVSVEVGGTLVVSSGGTATGIDWTPCEGSVSILEGASASFASQYSGVYYGSANHLVSSAPVVESMTLSYDEMLLVMSGGTANETAVYDGSELGVSSGGIANGTTIQEWGSFHVYAGGTANHTLLGYGTMDVFAGGTVNDITISEGGELYVSGGTANDVSLNANGYLHVYDGGTANRVVFLDGGAIDVYDGGVVNDVALSAGGSLSLYDGSVANGVFLNENGSLWLDYGATLNDTTLNAGVNLGFDDGMTVNGITVNPGATLSVNSYATATVTDIVENGGYVQVSETASATFQSHTVTGLELVEGTSATAHSGTTLNGATVGVGGLLEVFSGGSAVDLLENGGYVSLEDGAQVKFKANTIAGLELNGRSASAHSGTTLNGAVITESGELELFAGGTAINAAVNGNGSLHVFSGGTATAAAVDLDGCLYVSSGGTAANTEVGEGGILCVSSGGTATGIVWTPCVGHVFVQDGGFATFAEEYSGAYLGSMNTLISSFTDGSVTLSLDSAYEMYVFSDCTADAVEVNSGARLEVWSGGRANDTTVRYNGIFQVSSGGAANGVVVSSGGSLGISSKGVADDILVNNYASLHIYGGTATNVSVMSGARLSFTVTKDALITGSRSGVAFEIRDGRVSGYEIPESCQLALQSGVVADGVSVLDDGMLTISSGAVANSAVAGFCGIVVISSGGTANGTEITSGGSVHISSGGTANNTVVDSEGFVYLSGGGTANNTVVSSEGYLFVSSGGLAKSTTASSGAVVHVSSGGTANQTRLDSGALVYVFGGGTANDAVVSSGGLLTVEGGAVISGITVQDGGILNLCVSSDTNAAWTFAGSSCEIVNGVMSDASFGCGTLTFEFGGTANDITVNAGGTVEFFVEGVANGITVTEGGSATIYDSSTTGGLVVSSGGVLTVHGGTTTDITAYEGAYLRFSLSSGTHVAGTSAGAEFEIMGTSISDYVIGCGELIVSRGCAAENVTALEEGALLVLSGGMAKGAAINGGTMQVNNGGTADNTLMSGGSLTVRLATVTGTTVGDGTVTIQSGGVADNTLLNGGELTIRTNGAASDTTLRAGSIVVTSGGAVHGTTVSSGTFRVESAGIANGTVLDGGLFSVQSDGAANSTTINSGGKLSISGGVANGTVVNSGGSADVKRGSANGITVNLGGSVRVDSGAASGIVENGGYVRIDKDATAEFKTNVISALVIADTSASVHSGTTVEGATVNGGLLEVFAGGSASGIVENGGYVRLQDGAAAGFKTNVISGLEISDTSASIHSGTTVEGATVNGGLLEVFAGGSAAEIVENGGYVMLHDGAAATFKPNVISGLEISETSATIHSGTTLDGVTVNGGLLKVFAGGRMTGRMVFGEGSDIFAYAGAILDFDLTGATADASALVNDLSFVQGAPDFTITVSDEIAPGTYLLAEGAAGFGQTVTILDISGESLGEIAVGGSVVTAHAVYAMALDDTAVTGALTLTVAANGLPVVDDIQVSTTDPTNQDVTITARFMDDVGLAASLYRIGETGVWIDYDEGVTVSENAVVYFKAVDVTGNESEIVGCTVGNIDKVAPEKPSASADVTAFTNGDVLVTAVFSDDSTAREYSLDGTEWTDYEAAVTLTENGTVFFRAADEAGNVSEVAEFTVDNIDKTAPTAPTGLKAVVSDRTVALIWSVSMDNLAGVDGYLVTYSLDGQTFTANTTGTGFVLDDAAYGTWEWSVQAIDAAGNESGETAGEAFTVSESVTPGPQPEPGPEPVASSARNDINGNGISDVTFHWVGGDHQIGFWLDGTSQWQSQAQARSADWEILGTYDVDANGKADLLMAGKATIIDMTGMYIGYYEDSIDTADNWHTIGFLNDASNWNTAVGNLTGAIGRNSIVWYAPELYTLGAWTDGTSNWVTMTGSFGGDDWKLVGCGDFDGDGKDSVVMSGANGAYFYAADLDGTVTSMGASNWSGWAVRAIGDFLGDGKDDLVLFHEELGSMVMLADGNLDDFTSIGQLDAADWFVVGAGDYNADQKDDLLVRQYSTGMLGYYTSGDVANGWVELGRGVDMNWTVIA